MLVLSAGLPYDLREGSNDLALYREAGESILRGEVPYRDFFVEYPPGSLPAFVPPALFGASRSGYTNAFSVEMAALLATTLLLTAVTARRIGGARAPILPCATFAAAALLLYPVALTRYDAVVALTLGLATLFATSGRRFVVLAFASLGLGAAAKVIPALATLPLAFSRRSLASGYAVFLAVVAMFFVPFALLGGRGLSQSFVYQAERGLQVESLAASVLIFFRSARGVAFEYGAFEVRGGGVGLASALSPPLAVALLTITGFVIFGEHRRSGGPVAAAFPRQAAALILAFMLGSRVLSPQYMIWLLPLVPLGAAGATGAVVCAVFLAACLLTTQVFPVHYGDLLAFSYPGPELLLARNVLLLMLWISMLVLPAMAGEKRSP